jgi:O-antigen/teichoic acid export membrane protein
VDETFSAYLALRLLFAAIILVVLAVVAVALGSTLAAKTRLDALAVLAATVPLDAASDVWATRLRRAMRFGRLGVVDAASAIAASGLGVGLAASGAGFWALVWSRVSYQLLRAAGLWLASVERTRPRLARQDAVWLLRFGLPLWIGGLATTWVFKYDGLVVGTLWGAMTLGYYGRAYALVMLPMNLVGGVLTRVSMPLYARLQGERARLSEAFRIVAGTTFRVVVLLAAGMALVVPDLLAVMRWWRWAPIVPLLRWLLPYAVLRPLMDDAGGLLTALGHPKVAARTFVGQAVALLVLCPALACPLGATGAAVSIGLVVAGGLAVWYVRVLPRFLDVAYRRVFPVPLLLSAAVGTEAGFVAAAWARFDVGLAGGVLKLAVLCVVYAVVLVALDGRQTAADLRTLWRHAFGEARRDG